jgi:nucleotide-binding universal stress UspA family protein
MNTSPQDFGTLDAEPRTATARLLVPIDATERSRWGIKYALACRDSGRDVAVWLLLVNEPVTSWQVLRFMTQEQVRRFQAARARDLLGEAVHSLRQAGIPVQSHDREGDIAFEILDFAEQLQCDEIVLPAPYPRWAKLFTPDITREVLRRKRTVGVTTVDCDGVPERSLAHAAVM